MGNRAFSSHSSIGCDNFLLFILSALDDDVWNEYDVRIQGWWWLFRDEKQKSIYWWNMLRFGDENNAKEDLVNVMVEALRKNMRR